MHGTSDVHSAPPTPRLSRSIEAIRAEFPALRADEVRLDGAAGTLVPAAVIDAVADALRFSMANIHGEFAASRHSTETVASARAAIADLLGGDPDGVVLGPSMTTLTFRLADTLWAAWKPGDEVVVASLDHDANIRPWVLAAERAGATVRWAEFDPATGELPAEAFDGLIGDRTRLVALTAASNAIGTKPDVPAITDRAHAAGALTYVDGVHATPHGPIDVAALGADFYAFSTYKLFGPHTGAVIADPARLETLRPPKLVPLAGRGPRPLRARNPGVRAAGRRHPKVIGRFDPGFEVHNLAFANDGKRAWVTSANRPDVTVFDGSEEQPLFRVAAGAPPQHVALSGGYAYLTSGYGSTIELVDAHTGRVLRRASTPYGSFELAADGRYVVVSSPLRNARDLHRTAPAAPGRPPRPGHTRGRPEPQFSSRKPTLSITW